MAIKEQEHEKDIKCDQMASSSTALTNFVKISENYRKRFSDRLRRELQESDIQRNKIFELEQNRQLLGAQLEIVTSQYEKVFDSVNAISNAKNLEDKYKYQIEQLTNLVDCLRREKHEEEQNVFQRMKERDTLRDELKDMTEAKLKGDRERAMQNIQSREQIERMRDVNSELHKQRDKFEEDFLRASEEVRNLIVDKERLR